MPKGELLGETFEPVADIWAREPLAARIADVAAGSFRRHSPPEVRSTGHVVRSLEAALCAFHQGKSFREGALLAVNLGRRLWATRGRFLRAGIPQPWRGRIAAEEKIADLAERLCALAQPRL